MGGKTSVAVASGTVAPHLAYPLAGIGPGGEVLVSLITCTATNIPLLYLGAVPVFVDVEPGTINFDVEDERRRVTDKTKGIVVVHFGGRPWNMNEIGALASELGIPIIKDATHALGAEYKGQLVGSINDYTIFLFGPSSI